MKKTSVCAIFLALLLCILVVGGCVGEKYPIGMIFDLEYSQPHSYQYRQTSDFSNDYSEYFDNEVIKYTELKNIYYYDKTTDSFVTYSRWGGNEINVLDAETADWKREISLSGNNMYNANFDVGYMYGDGVVLDFYSTYGTPAEVTLTVKSLKSGEVEKTRTIMSYTTLISPAGYCGDIFIYSPYDGNTVFLNMATGESYQSEKYIGTTNSDTFLVNQSQKILYAAQHTNNGNGRTLNFLNIITGKTFKTIDVYDTNYNYGRIDLSFIGENYISFSDKIYDAVSGESVSGSPLLKQYNSLIGFTPTKTLWTEDKYDIVSGYSESGYLTAIYDNELNKYVFRADGKFGRVEKSESGKFHLLNYYSWDVNAVVNTDMISGVLSENFDGDMKIEKEWDGRVHKVYFSKKYTDIAASKNYLYIAAGNTVSVYNNDYEPVKSLYFEKDVFCLDAQDGTLALGFGAANKFFAVVSTDDWRVKEINTETGVTDIAIYNGSIYYTGRAYWDYIYYFDIKQEKTVQIGSSYYCPYFALNKETGMLYIAESGISSSDIVYYDLKRNMIIYTSAFSEYGYNYYPVILGGKYIHYYGEVLNPITGKKLNEKIFPYRKGSNFLGVIYSNERNKVCVEEIDGKKYTVVCDTLTNRVVELPGDAERVLKVNDLHYIVRPGSNFLYCVNM